MKRIYGVAAILGSMAFMTSACTGFDGGDGKNSPNVENVANTLISYEEWKQTVYQEPDTGIYIVDGDIPLHDEAELMAFYERNVLSGALIVHRVAGADVVWNSTAKLNISYCIATASFTPTEYGSVVAAMSAAAADWENAANVNFDHRISQDRTCTQSNPHVVFDVRKTNGAGYLARAFSPNDSRENRNVLIDATAFSSPNLTLTGILRHALGHTLGFRHEHTRPQAQSCFEDSSYRELTTYDSSSVMHYPECNGTQTGDLVLTAKDKEGAAAAYGCGTNNDQACCNDGNASDCGLGDFLAPATGLTAPSANSTLTGMVTLSANASDNVGVTKVEFYRDSTLIGTDTTAPYSVSWNSGAVPNGTYTVRSRAYDAVGNTRTSMGVTVFVDHALLLANGVAVTNISGVANWSSLFRLVVPAGKSTLNFTTSGGTGDVSMYVRKSALPTSSSYDCASAVAGNTETCTFNNPVATTYYVQLYGNSIYSGVSLTGTYGVTSGDTFTTDSLLNYEIVDLGPNAGPSAWSVSGGVMNQTSNIYGDGSRELGEEGTYAVRRDRIFSNDQTHEVKLMSSDNDGMGLVWNWVDSNNFYHVYWDGTNNRIAFTKVIGGVATRVAYVAQSRVASQWYTLEVTTTGSTIQVYLDNTLILTTSDSSLSSGQAGFFTVGNIGTAFDDYSSSGN